LRLLHCDIDCVFFLLLSFVLCLSPTCPRGSE
jgi:hypothetical protein